MTNCYVTTLTKPLLHRRRQLILPGSVADLIDLVD